MQKITLNIKKMHCASCSIRIDGDLEELPGVKSSQTNYHNAKSIVEFDETQTNLDQIKKTIQDAGYEAEEA